MAVDIDAIVASLQASYTKVVRDLAALPPLDFSEEGRAIQITAARESLTKQLGELEQRLAALGAPVGTIGMPALSITSTEGWPKWHGTLGGGFR